MTEGPYLLSPDVYVAEAHPFYQVFVDGKLFDTLEVINGGPRLTWSQMTDIALGFAGGLS